MRAGGESGIGRILFFARLPPPCRQDMIASPQPGRDGYCMRQKIMMALLLSLVALGAAACDKCGNFLGQPTGQPHSCK